MENAVVELNQYVGYHLLKFIDGIEAVNFIETVNDSHQFWSIARTSDYYFIEKIKEFCGHERILLPRVLFEDFGNEDTIQSWVTQFNLLS